MNHFPRAFGRVLLHEFADVDVHDVVGTELNRTMYALKTVKKYENGRRADTPCSLKSALVCGEASQHAHCIYRFPECL